MRNAWDTTRPRARGRMSMMLVSASLWARGWPPEPGLSPLPRRCLQVIVPDGASRSLSLACRIAQSHRARGWPAIVRQVVWRGNHASADAPEVPIRAPRAS